MGEFLSLPSHRVFLDLVLGVLHQEAFPFGERAGSEHQIKGEPHHGKGEQGDDPRDFEFGVPMDIENAENRDDVEDRPDDVDAKEEDPLVSVPHHEESHRGEQEDLQEQKEGHHVAAGELLEPVESLFLLHGATLLQNEREIQ